VICLSEVILNKCKFKQIALHPAGFDINISAAEQNFVLLLILFEKCFSFKATLQKKNITINERRYRC